jgi:hypothetical protein
MRKHRAITFYQSPGKFLDTDDDSFEINGKKIKPTTWMDVDKEGNIILDRNALLLKKDNGEFIHTGYGKKVRWSRGLQKAVKRYGDTDNIPYDVWMNLPEGQDYIAKHLEARRKGKRNRSDWSGVMFVDSLDKYGEASWPFAKKRKDQKAINKMLENEGY